MKYYCDSHRHLVCLPYSIENLHKMAEDLDIKNKIMWERDIFSETKKNDDDIMLDLDDISNKRSFNKKDFIDTVIKNYEKLQNITIFVGDESCNCGLDFKRN